MACVDLLKRSRQKKIVFYCRVKKEYINFPMDCKNCSSKNFKNVGIKKKSIKLIKLERQRDKYLIKYGKCDFCGKYSKRLDPHEVYGGSNRQRSIRYGFIRQLCRKCHSNEDIIEQLKEEVQKEYEKTHTREQFIALIGKSYL